MLLQNVQQNLNNKIAQPSLRNSARVASEYNYSPQKWIEPEFPTILWMPKN